MLHPGRDGAGDEARARSVTPPLIVRRHPRHGQSGSAPRPMVSGRPHITLRFWIA